MTKVTGGAGVTRAGKRKCIVCMEARLAWAERDKFKATILEMVKILDGDEDDVWGRSLRAMMVGSLALYGPDGGTS